MKHASFGSCIDVSNLFEIIFSDPDVAPQFPMGRWKCSYMIAYSKNIRELSWMSHELCASDFY